MDIINIFDLIDRRPPPHQDIEAAAKGLLVGALGQRLYTNEDDELFYSKQKYNKVFSLPAQQRLQYVSQFEARKSLILRGSHSSRIFMAAIKEEAESRLEVGIHTEALIKKLQFLSEVSIFDDTAPRYRMKPQGFLVTIRFDLSDIDIGFTPLSEAKEPAQHLRSAEFICDTTSCLWIKLRVKLTPESGMHEILLKPNQSITEDQILKAAIELGGTRVEFIQTYDTIPETLPTWFWIPGGWEASPTNRKSYEEIHPAMCDEVAALVEAFPFGALNFLDAGCGSGALSQLLMERLGQRVAYAAFDV